MVTESTLFDYLALFFIAVIIIRGMYYLLKQSGGAGIKRYRLAILANSMNCAVLNFFKLLVLSFFITSIYMVGAERSIEDVLSNFLNGVDADVGNAIIHVISIFVVYHAFRFCHKEFAE